MRLNLPDDMVDAVIEALRHAVKTTQDPDSFLEALSRVELEAQGSRMTASEEKGSGRPILRWTGSQQAHDDYMALQRRAGRH